MTKPKKQKRGQNEGSFRQRPDGTWEARVSLGVDKDGKPIRKSVYASTKEAALEKARALHVLPPSAHEKIEKVTVSKLAELWIKSLVTLGRERATIAFYRSQLTKHIEPAIGAMQANRMTAGVVEALLAKLERRTKTATYDTLNPLFRFGVDRGHLREHPMAKLRKPRIEAAEGIQFWTPDEVAKVRNALESSPWLPLYELGFWTGMRRGEIFALRWRYVDLDKGIVRVESALEEVEGKLDLKAPKTKQSRRSLDIPKQCVEILKRHKAKAKRIGADDLVFADRDGNPIRRSNFDRRVHHPLIERAKVAKISLKEGFRHTHASLLLASGTNIKVISERLGHTNIRTTLNAYAHLMPTAQGSALEKLEALFAEGTTKATDDATSKTTKQRKRRDPSATRIHRASGNA